SHATNFWPISNNTKKEFFKLFHAGHSSSSAYHTYLAKIQLKYDNDEDILADRAICLHKHDIYYLHQKFLDQIVGIRNGKEMFLCKSKEIVEFNNSHKETGLNISNILLTLISTSTPIGGLPLITILISDETVSTFTKTFEAIKHILLLDAFGGY
ncbi:9477_t:CDS:2, partial [Cetraspora pellucida]